VSTHKSPKIAKLIAHLRHDRYDARYLGYFECFNAQLYYEAHDVLEDLWLEKRNTDMDHFYKGLIQLAGAFVHLKKNRLDPGARLFRLCRRHLAPYATHTEGLDVDEVLRRINGWLQLLESSDYASSPYDPAHPPRMMPKL
jgi:predicted metal-dependent hydrolase